MMNAEEIISFIQNSKKSTPVKVYLKGRLHGLEFGPSVRTFLSDHSGVVIGEWLDIQAVLIDNAGQIEDYYVEQDRHNSAVPLLDIKNVHARIEPGAIIREHVTIGSNAVVMMGAVINIGAEIGENTMIDINAVIGGRGIVGKNCHIGAGAVVAGIVEPASATPTVVEDDVFIGANAVLLEGVRVAKGSVVAAGAVVVDDVPPNVVVAGIPARIIKAIDGKTRVKTEIRHELRQLNAQPQTPAAYPVGSDYVQGWVGPSSNK